MVGILRGKFAGKFHGDPVGLYVNDKLVAYGEVVVVEDNFGIKITELVGSQPETAA